MEISDNQLLEDFRKTGSDSAFAELVERHAGLVFSAALRRTKRHELAEDTAQIVFAILMRKAARLVDHPCLPAWLHKTASLEAGRIMRTERNHRRKLERLANSSTDERTPVSPEHPAAEHLDVAIASLAPNDRRVLFLRFYQGYNLREIAGITGKSEVATRKQSERAIARLAGALGGRGVVVPAVSLATVLTTALTEPARAGLAVAITQGAASASASLGASALITNTIQTMTYGKQIALTAAAVGILAAIPIVMQNTQVAALKSELEELRGEPVRPALPHPVVAVAATARPTPNPASGQTGSLRHLLTGNHRASPDQLDSFIGTERSLGELESLFAETLKLSPNAPRDGALQKILFEIGKHDGELAVQLANSFEALELRGRSLESAYRGWGTHDPFGAWDYASALSPLEQLKQPWTEILFGAAMGDLDVGVVYDFIEQNYKPLRGHSNTRLWGALNQIYDEKDSAGMPAWIESLPSGSLKDFASRQLIQRWAESSPTEALAWMENNVDLKANVYAPYELVKSWAEVKPTAAIDWLTALPEELQNPKYYEGLFEKWLKHDQIEAASWLAKAEPSALLDNPFEQYIGRISRTDPAEAMNWAESITNLDTRARIVKQVATAWRSADPEGFEKHQSVSPN